MGGGLAAERALTYKHRALDSAPALHKFGVQILFYILTLGKQRQEDQKFNYPLLLSDFEVRLY